MVLDFASWCRLDDRISTTGFIFYDVVLNFIDLNGINKTKEGGKHTQHTNAHLSSSKCIILIVALQVHTLFV